MSLDSTTVELRKDNIVVDVPIPVLIDINDPTTVYVFAGAARQPVPAGEYILKLDNEAQNPKVWPTNFTITPKPALITRANALMLPTDAVNRIYVQRTLPLTTDFEATDAFIKQKIEDEFNEVHMKLQQLHLDNDIDGTLLARAIVVPEGELGKVVPPIPARATRIFAYDANGIPIPSNLTLAQIEAGVVVTVVPNTYGTVESIAELRLITGVSTAKIIVVQSYYADGFIGGGTFQLGPNDPLGIGDDGGLCIQDAAGRYWHRIVETHVTAEMFGLLPFASYPIVVAGEDDITYQDTLNALANACYKRNVPLRLTLGGMGPALMKPTQEGRALVQVNPSLGGNDKANFAILKKAINWQQSCSFSYGAVIVLEITGFSQGCEIFGSIHTGDFTFVSGSTPLVMDMGNISLGLLATPPVAPLEGLGRAMPIDTTKPVTWGPRKGMVTFVHVLKNGANPATGTGGYLSGGSGTLPPVAANGNGGVGALVTFGVTNGVITGGIVTNGGEGYTLGTPADGKFDIIMPAPAGGGATAEVEAFINPNIFRVSFFVPELPPNLAIGMPIGLEGVTSHVEDEDGVITTPAPNDAGGINGGGIIVAHDNAAKKIFMDWTFPRVTDPVDGNPTAGNVYFPPRWFVVTGGFTVDGFITSNDRGQVKMDHIYAAYDQSKSLTQPSREENNGVSIGVGNSNVRFADWSIFVGFPQYAFRLVGSYGSYLNRCFIGGGILGKNGIVVQNGGDCVTVCLQIGGFKSSALVAGRGCFINGAGSVPPPNIGSCDTGCQAEGGDIQWTSPSAIHSCIIGALARGRGWVYTRTATIRRCTTGEYWDGDGMILGPSKFDGNVKNRKDDIPIDMYAQAGASIDAIAVDIGQYGRGGTLVMASETAGSFVLSPDQAFLALNSSVTPTSTAPVGIVFLRSNAAVNPVSIIWKPDETNVEYTTGVLANGGGNAGKLTISVNSATKTVYLSNRLGASRTYNWSAMGGL